jgi:polar amino acid transport system substrate-binding protein
VLDIGNPAYDVLVETTVLRDLDFFGWVSGDIDLKPDMAWISGKIKKPERVVIFGNDYKIPKIYKEDGEAKGILVAIARLIDDRMADYTFEIRLFPWARAYQHALHGRGGIIGLSKTSGREAIFDYSEVIYHDKVVIVTLREKAFDYRSVSDLKGKTIGIGRGGSFGDEYEQAKANGLFQVEEDSGPVIRLKKLLKGRIDCALISPGRFALNQTIRQDPLLTENRERFIILPQPFKQDPNYLGFVKTMNMGDFLNAFNNTLREAKASGAAAEIIDRYEGGGTHNPSASVE